MLYLYASLLSFIFEIFFRIRKFLSFDTCKILIHAFITSRIDYCNIRCSMVSQNVFYSVRRVSLKELQGSFTLGDVNMSLVCLFSFIGSLLKGRSLLKLLPLHSRLFMVLDLTISLSSPRAHKTLYT